MTTVVIVVVSGVAIRALDPDEYASIWEGMWCAAAVAAISPTTRRRELPKAA